MLDREQLLQIGFTTQEADWLIANPDVFGTAITRFTRRLSEVDARLSAIEIRLTAMETR